MDQPASRKTITRALAALAAGQIVGWGTLGLPAAAGSEMAAALDMSLAAIFAGSSALYLAMGLSSWALSRSFGRYGARLLLMAGAAAAAPGFVLLAAAHGPVGYYCAWMILGAAGGATLSTAAHIMLAEIGGKDARRAIGALMLATGLSNSIFWPATAFLTQTFGWRIACLVYAAAMLVICAPLYAFHLPKRVAPCGSPAEQAGSAGATAQTPKADRKVFRLIVAAIALNAFVTYGLSIALIELLKSLGIPSTTAIAYGSALGVAQVAARGLDFLGGDRWDSVTTGLVASAAIPLAMLLLMAVGGAPWAIAAFILLYGLASGAMAVARATIPLAFYDKAAYARAAARIALPLNLMSALAPPVMAAALTRFGADAVLGLAAVLSGGALCALALLRRLRRRQAGCSSPSSLTR